MKTITKKEYKDALESYIASYIEIFESPSNRDKFEWELIEGLPGTRQRDMTRYVDRDAAMKSAIYQVQTQYKDILLIARTDTNEYMKFNGLAIAREARHA